MASQSEQDRLNAIRSGAQKPKGQITAHEMGSMGGQTVRELVNAGKEQFRNANRKTSVQQVEEEVERGGGPTKGAAHKQY